MVGVVVAGVLGAFVVPGPFDWGSTLIGLLFLVILVAYADLTPGSWQSALATSAAGAFALLFVVGHLLDRSIETDSETGERSRWLSGWPVPSEPADTVAPDPSGGGRILLVWLGLTLVLLASFGAAAWLDRRRRPRAHSRSPRR